MKKSELQYNIYEVSNNLSVPVTTIRRWLKRLDILPSKAGYYDQNDLELLESCRNFVKIPGNTITKFIEVINAKG